MVWVKDPANTVTFTIAQLIEGNLHIDRLTVLDGTYAYDLILNGLVTGTNAAVHPTDTVTIQIVGKNTGNIADNFQMDCKVGTAAVETSPLYAGLAVNATTPVWTPSTFVMPSSNVSVTINTYHEAPY